MKTETSVDKPWGREFRDLSGSVFGRWRVLHRADTSKDGGVAYDCECECGVKKKVHYSRLKRGLSKSCGCLRTELQIKRQLIDLTGCKFGRLTVLGRAPNKKGEGTRWHCVCECGAEKSVHGKFLSRGDTLSCGCLFRERASQRLITHGQTGSATYHIWSAMKRRCHKESSKDWNNYGGRGITVCDRWRHSFENFMADMGPKPNGMSLDRIDNNKGYSKDNCRWATTYEQRKNQRKYNYYKIAEIIEQLGTTGLTPKEISLKVKDMANN